MTGATVKRAKTSHKSATSKKSSKPSKNIVKQHEDAPQYTSGPVITEPDADELRLTQLLFGGDGNLDVAADGAGETAEQHINLVEQHEDVSDALFSIDTAGDTVHPSITPDITDDTDNIVTADKADDTDAPAWTDANDAELTVNIANVNRLRKLRSAPEESVITGTEYSKRIQYVYNKLHAHNTQHNWATKAQQQKDDDLAFLTHADVATNKLHNRHTGGSLPAGIIDVLPLKDGNMNEPTRGVVNSVGWHCNGQIMFTAGMDKTVKLFNIDGVKNRKLHGVHLADLPVHCAQMTHDGTEIVISGRRSYFYTYNVDSGVVHRVPGVRGMSEKSYENFAMSGDSKSIAFTCDNGYIALVDRLSKQCVGKVKLNGLVRSVAWSSDSKHLYAYGDESDVYVFDVGTRQCMARHYDNAGVHGQTVAVSGNGQHYATGSDSGIVNVYATENLHMHAANSIKIQPIHTLTNITVPVDGLVYNHDSQILCATSKRVKDVLKLYNTTHSYGAFSNWPTVNTPLHYVSCSSFSPNSGYLAVGNDRGRVLLYRLKHYNTG